MKYLTPLVASVMLPSCLWAGTTVDSLEPATEVVPSEGIPDWVPSLQVGYLHQFNSDLNDGGSFSVDRAVARVGISRVFDRDRIIGVSFSYGYDGYRFDDLIEEPWSDIHTMGLAFPVRWALAEDWSLFAVPTVLSTVESGASFSDGLTGGFLGGAAYAFGDHLVLGPGIGVLSQLEDSASVFPILIIKWNITDTLKLETGRGFGASQGPGLNLVWQASDQWKITLGSRYEKKRFRLNDKGLAPEGVGEDRGIPVYLGASYATSQFSELSVYAGAKFGGTLTRDDDAGRQIARSDYDTAAFVGLAWKWGF